MNDGVQNEPVGTRLFNTNPFIVAFKHAAAEGFVALGATDRLLRITLDAQGGPASTRRAPNPGDPGPIVRIEMKDPEEIVQPDPDYTIGGRNPRGCRHQLQRHARVRHGLPVAGRRRRRRIGQRSRRSTTRSPGSVRRISRGRRRWTASCSGARCSSTAPSGQRARRPTACDPQGCCRTSAGARVTAAIPRR